MDRRQENGFTLIELLVVVAIIGILAGISISIYASAREKSFDAMAKEDLRNAIAAQEAQFVESETFVECANQVACVADLPGYRGSDNVDISFTVPADDQYVGVSSHPSGSVTWEFDNHTGNIIEQ